MALAAGNTHSSYRLTRAACSNPLGGLHEFLDAPTGLVSSRRIMGDSRHEIAVKKM
jgi:hypothetical protein